MGALAEPAAFLLDPLNITGAQGQVSSAQPRGSYVMGGDNVQQPYNSGPSSPGPSPQQGKYKGFIESMGGWDGSKFFRGDGNVAAPPPPPKWTYQPGKGAVWSDPQRVGSTNEFTFNPSPDPSKFGGNRF
jgi:hypothetical protein